MSIELETPPAPAASATAAEHPGRPSADEPANLTGQALRAALAHSARNRRGGVPAAQGTTAPNGHPKPNGADSPAGAAQSGKDEAHSASTPEEAAADEITDPQAAETLAALEADAATEAESQPDGEPEEAESAPEEPKGVRDLQKRVGKLTAKLKAYEAKFGSLDGSNRPEEAQAPTDAPVLPEHQHPEIAAIDDQIAAYESHLQWLDANPDGGDYTDAQGQILARIAPERVAAMRRAAERKVTELTARRASKAERIQTQHQQAVREADQQAVQRYPWLNNPEAAEHRQASTILAELPRSVVAALQSVPKARLYLGALVEGMKVQEAKATPKPTQRPTPPKVMGAAVSAAPRSTPQDGLRAQLSEAEAEYAKSGSRQTLTRVLKLRRQVAMA